MRSYRIFSLVAALALGGAGLGACSLGSSGGISREDAKQIDSLLADARAAGARAKPMATDAKLPEVERREITSDDDQLAVTLNSVTVKDGLTTVIFTVKNENKTSSSTQIGGIFDDGSSNVPKDSDGTQGEDMYDLATGTTDGVMIVDGKNQMVYRAAYDSSGHCLCSSNLGDSYVHEGQSYILLTTFAELPKDVDSVTVSIPRAGTFNDVKVNR